MRCSKCQREILPGQKFCNHCGQTVIDMPSAPVGGYVAEENVPRCHACNAPLSPGVKFCKACGTPQVYEGPPKKKGNTAVIILSIVLAIVLIIGGVFVYLTINDSLPFLSDYDETQKDDDSEDEDYEDKKKDDKSEKESEVSDASEEVVEEVVEEVEESDSDSDDDILDHAEKDKDGFLFPSNKKYITEKDLEGLPASQVALIRNEIFARHGYIFQTEPNITYFSSKSWYVPNPNFTNDLLNDYEAANAEFILQYEKDKGWK